MKNLLQSPSPQTRFQVLEEAQLILELWPERGCPLLFYPGTMLEPGHYRLLLDNFCRAGFSVCALHLPGHGKNHAPLANISQCLKLGDLAAKWLKKKLKAPVLLCGHSQGGIMALLHASAVTDVAACFAISAAFPQMEAAIHITRFGRFSKHREKLLKIINLASHFFPWLPIPLPLYLSGHKILAGRKKPVIFGRGKGRISYPLKFLDSLFNAQAKLPIAIPCWFFASKNDGLFSFEISKESFFLANPPKGEIIWLEDGGHMAIFNEKLANYIARSCAAKAASLGLPLQLKTTSL